MLFPQNITVSMVPFSFPALAASPPSRRNWYQELLDHPDCDGPKQVSEAYESHRVAYIAKNIDAFTSTTNPVTPDQALLSHLRRQTNSQKEHEPSTEEMGDLEVNCLGISARPSLSTVSTIQDIQTRMYSLLGPDFYAMPVAHLHIAMVELAHRHTLSYLRSVSSQVGRVRLQQMLDRTSELPQKPRLVAPRLSFDASGIALTYIPDAKQTCTYHHLRAEMQERALESGVEFDMCYTAPSAHITLGRFTGSDFFDSSESRARFVKLVEMINEDLENGSASGGWALGEEQSLELQAGYLKFGVGRDGSEMLGKSE